MSDNPLGPPPWLNAPPVPEYPYEETHDLRHGPDLHPHLLGLLPFVGVWRGRGKGGYPTIPDFDFAQEIRISHDGRPFLRYDSRSWLIEDDGTPIRPAARETGWWRPVVVDDKPTDEIEVLLSSHIGIISVLIGRVDHLKIEMATDIMFHTATAKEVNSEHRLYGIVDGALLDAQGMAAVGRPMADHLSARLPRVAG